MKPPSNNCNGSSTRITSAAAAKLLRKSTGRTNAQPTNNTLAITSVRTAPESAPVANTYSASAGMHANPLHRRGTRNPRNTPSTTTPTSVTFRPETEKM